MTLPNLMIAGVNKAGTTGLFTQLARHPRIGPAAVKETCYFLPLRYGRELAPLGEYEALFESAADFPVRLESTPGYFYGGRPLARTIDHTLPEARLVIVLREPVSRLISFYRFQKSRLALPADLTLAAYLAQCRAMSAEQLDLQKNNPWFGLAGGEYAHWLPAWMERFGPRLKVLFFDDLVNRPRQVLREVFAFAGVEADFADEAALTRENRTIGYRSPTVQRLALAVNHGGERFWRRHPRLKRSLRGGYHLFNGRSPGPEEDEATLAALRDHYQPHNNRLARQLAEAGFQRLPLWLGGDGSEAAFHDPANGNERGASPEAKR